MPMQITTVKFDPETMKILRSMAKSLEILSNPMYMSENNDEILMDEGIADAIKTMASKSAKDYLDKHLDAHITNVVDFDMQLKDG